MVLSRTTGLGIRVETNYREVQQRLKTSAPLIRKALNRDIRIYAKEIAEKAKSNASWSQQIPSAIGVSVTVKGANIRVKGVLGPLYERGEAGGGVHQTFRHPLFGNDTFWYEQQTRPFIAPAIKASAGSIAKIERSIQAAARAAGF